MKTKVLLSLVVIFSLLFSAQVEGKIIERLDSLITVDAEKEEIEKQLFIWSEEGLLEKHSTNGFEASWDGSLLPFYSIVDYVYNDLGLPIEVLTEKETITEFSAPQLSRVEYGYDEAGRVNDVAYSNFYAWMNDGEGGWSFNERVVTTRDSEGLLLDSTSYYIPFGSDDWVVSEEVILQYDEKKNIQSMESWTPNYETGELVLYSKTTYEYDSAEEGQTSRIGTALQYADAEMQPLDEPSMLSVEEVIFDADGSIISYERKTWEGWMNANEGGWYGQEKYTAARVPGVMGNYADIRTNYAWQFASSDWAISNIINETISSHWTGTKLITRTESVPNAEYDPEDENSQEFTKTKEEHLSYSDNQSIMSKRVTVWTEGVEKTEEEVYAIDEETPIAQVIIPISYTQDPYLFTYKPTTITIGEGSGFNITTTATATFHYTEIEVDDDETAITAVQANTVKAHFAEGTLNVVTPNAETVSVYSLSGNLLYTANKAEGATSFNLALAQGIYIIKGSTGWAVKAIK